MIWAKIHKKVFCNKFCFLLRAFTLAGSISTNVVYFIINCVFLITAYILIGLVWKSVVQFSKKNIFCDGALYLCRNNMQYPCVF